MRSFGKSLKSAVFSINFLISVTVGLVLLVSPKFSQILASLKYGMKMHWLYFTDLALINGSFTIFAPILAAFPYTARFCEEYESGYVKSILTRGRPVKYLLGKFTANGVAGGFALSVPLAVFVGFAIAIGEPYRRADVPDGWATVFEKTIFEKTQFAWGGIAVLLIVVVLAFLSGAVWANVGLCLSAFVQNKYLAVGFPLVLYYGVTVILVGTKIFGFSPMNLIYPTTFDSIPLYVNIPFQLFELLILLVAFIVKGRAVLKNV